jgi:hypothetical protein
MIILILLLLLPLDAIKLKSMTIISWLYRAAMT